MASTIVKTTVPSTQPLSKDRATFLAAQDKIPTVTIPDGMRLDSLFGDKTYLVRLAGPGAGRIGNNELTSFLVVRQLLTPEQAVSPHLVWFRQEEGFERYLSIRHPTAQPNPNLDGALFTCTTSNPARQAGIGSRVEVEVIHTAKVTCSYAIQWLPETVSTETVQYIAQSIGQVAHIYRDTNRPDMFHVKTTDPLDKIPHWVTTERLLKTEEQTPCDSKGQAYSMLLLPKY